MAGNKKSGSKGQIPKEISFDFIKSNHFRVVHVDGAFGGLGPNGRALHVSVFSERRPIPRRTTHKVLPSGQVAEELERKREERDGLVREVEVDLVMDLTTAISLTNWLVEKIEEWQRISVQLPIDKKGNNGV